MTQTTETASRSLVRSLYAVDAAGPVAVSVADGPTVVGHPSRIDRDEAGIRVEVCPYEGDAPQYRVRAHRTPAGWQPPYVERRSLTESWTRCGRLADVTPAPRTPEE